MAVRDVLSLWAQLEQVAHPYLAPIETEQQYEEALRFLEQLWDEVADDPTSPYGSLLKILSDNLSTFENTRQPMPDATPRQVLGFLMAEKQVTQKELEDACGIYQSNLSQILKGKRKLTTEQVKLLADYFKVSPVVFL
ncbi:hypothetical protein BH24DEI2_BH24DEI2_24560 [soil metagenome]